MKVVTNMESSKPHTVCTCTNDDLQKANELTDFYLQFQNHDFSDKC